MHRLEALLAAIPLSLVCGCGPFFVHGSVQEVCYTVEQAVPAMPGSAEAPSTARLPIEYQLGEELSGAGLTLALLSLELSGRGVHDLGFIDSLELRTAAPCGGEARAAVTSDACPAGKSLLQYQRRDADAGGTVALAPEQPVELGSTLDGASMRFETLLHGRMPEEDWALDATVCFRVDAAL